MLRHSEVVDVRRTVLLQARILYLGFIAVELKTPNEMMRKSIIGPYAIGGAVAAFRYEDVDVTNKPYVYIVTELPPAEAASFPFLHTFLTQRGYPNSAGTAEVDGWTVNFHTVLHPRPFKSDILVKEAVENADETTFDGLPIRILTQQYLLETRTVPKTSEILASESARQRVMKAMSWEEKIKIANRLRLGFSRYMWGR